MLSQPTDLKVPEEVKAAAKLGRLTFFIGNGVSRLYGLPSWDELANKMLRKLASCGILNHSLVEILSRYPTKVKISIADHYFRENRISKKYAELTYKNLLMGDLKDIDLHKKTPVYKLIADCNVRLLTTNYDSILPDILDGVTADESVLEEAKIETGKPEDDQAAGSIKAYGYKIFKNLHELEESTLTGNNILVHLHGSIRAEDALIASTQSYLKFYGNEANQNRLNLLFKKQTIIFFGYGLEELEILDLLLRSSKTLPETQESPRFFLVLSLLSHEFEILKHLQVYYSQLGVVLLAYSRDEKDFHALTDVLEEWTKVIKPLVNPPSQHDHSFLREDLRKKFNEARDHAVSEMIKLLRNNPIDEAIFFEEESNNKWLTYLVPAGFFKVELVKPLVQEGNSYYYPGWPQGVYLEKVAQNIHTKVIVDEEFIKFYINLLRTFFAIRENLWAIRAIFRSVYLIPSKYLEVKDISDSFDMIESMSKKNDFIELDLHESYFNLVKTIGFNDKERSVLKEYTKNLLRSKNEEGSGYRERKLVFFKEYRFKNFVEKFLKIQSDLGDHILFDTVEVANSLLGEHLKDKDIDKTSVLWRPAVEPHSQNKFHDSAPSVLTGILYELSSISLSRGKLLEELQGWKKSKQIIFSRIYIALVTRFSQYLNPNECAIRILQLGLRTDFKHEIFQFLKEHFEHINQENQDAIIDSIAKLEDTFTDVNDPRKPLMTAWKKMRWLQAIKDSSNPKVGSLYQETFKITNAEAEHPDFNSFVSSTWVGPTSPLTLDELKKLAPSEIVEILINFKEKKDQFDEPSSEGLSRVLEEFVVSEPAESLTLVSNALKLPFIYQSALFDGYTKCFVDKPKLVQVKELLGLAKMIVMSEVFEKEVSDTGSKARWTANSIFRFISAGVRDDKNAFNPCLNFLCHEILEHAVKIVMPSKDYKGSSDAQTRAINEPRGVLFETAILLALREARLVYNVKDKSSKDSLEFKEVWDKLYRVIGPPLEAQNNLEVSLHAHLGSLYRQILFLNKDWLLNNIDLVCPPDISKDDLWSAFMQGFSYVNVNVKEMYQILYQKGHLLRFLRYNQDPEGQSLSRLGTLQERIIALALISFVLKTESLKAGLVREILDFEDANEWNRMIHLIPQIIGKKPSKSILTQTKKLISYIVEKFENVEDRLKWKRHFSSLGWTLQIFKDPKDPLVKKIINIEAFYTNDYWDHHEIVDYLESYKVSHTETVGRLFLELIRGGKGYPGYPEDKIKAICFSLKQAGYTELLADVCSVYSRKAPNSLLTKEIFKIVG